MWLERGAIATRILEDDCQSHRALMLRGEPLALLIGPSGTGPGSRLPSARFRRQRFESGPKKPMSIASPRWPTATSSCACHVARAHAHKLLGQPELSGVAQRWLPAWKRSQDEVEPNGFGYGAEGLNTQLWVAELDADRRRPRHASAIGDLLSRPRQRCAGELHLAADPRRLLAGANPLAATGCSWADDGVPGLPRPYPSICRGKFTSAADHVRLPPRSENPSTRTSWAA